MTKRKLIALLAAFLLVLALVGVVLAQPDNISRSVIGGGGEEVSAGSYILNGTLGEPIASDFAQGTNYGHCSGFWCGAGAAGARVYLPIILRDY
jgi:hypothetical protein